ARSDAAERKKDSQKNSFAVNTPVYAHDFRLSRQWTAVVITKAHVRMIYDAEISGYGSIPYCSNKNKISSPGRSIVEDPQVICLRR
ncbi:unnamed protein product, partial [Hymenolepis diminuta]